MLHLRSRAKPFVQDAANLRDFCLFFVFNVDNVTDRSQLVQSAAAHPGGHQTGCSSSSPDVRGKIALLSFAHPQNAPV